MTVPKVVYVWTKSMSDLPSRSTGYMERTQGYVCEEFRLAEKKHTCILNDHGDLVFMKDDRPIDLIPRAMIGRVTFEYED